MCKWFQGPTVLQWGGAGGASSPQPISTRQARGPCGRAYSPRAAQTRPRDPGPNSTTNYSVTSCHYNYHHNRVLTECALAVLSIGHGQQDDERAIDIHCIEELSQQLNKTSDQLAYIRKVLDSFVSGQTPAVVTAASRTASGPAPASGSGCLPQGQATSLPQPSTASGSVNPSITPLAVITSAGMPPQPAMQVSFKQVRTFRIMLKLWLSRAMPITPQRLTFLSHSFPWTSNHGFHWGGYSCTGPVSELSPASTTAGSYYYWTVQGSPSQHHGQHLLQQRWAIINLAAPGTLPL